MLNRESIASLYILYISKLYNVLFFVIIVPNIFCWDSRYTVYLKSDMIIILWLCKLRIKNERINEYTYIKL